MTFHTAIARLNFRKTGIISISLILFSILFGFIFVPKFVKSNLRKQLTLKPNSDLRNLWAKAPFALTFKVYVFNITNPTAVMAGEKPHVQQIGPLMFDEWKEKRIIEDDDEADTVTFDMVNTFVFRPDLTRANGLTGDEIVTIPHLIIMGGLIAVQRDRGPLLPIAIKGIFEVINQTTPFLTARVMDILFDGVPVNCSAAKTMAGRGLCSQMRNEKSVKVINGTHLSFSIFGGANATSAGKFKVYRGIKDSAKLGEVVTVNDEEEIDAWESDDADANDEAGGVCRKYLGTDSTIFAPFHHKNDILYAFAPDLCRSLGAFYLHASSYNGVPTGYYGMDFGDIKGNRSQHCFCRNHDADKCPPKGTMDLYQCTKAPLIASKPQFLDADERLVANVDGLRPNREEHDIFIHLEMLSSTPLSAAKRLQFSMDVEPVERLDMMSKLRPVILPLVWVEESAHLNSTYTGIFRLLYTCFKINSAIKYLCLVCGSIGLAVAAYGIHKMESSDLQQQQHTVRHVNPPLSKSSKVTAAAEPTVESVNDEEDDQSTAVPEKEKY